MRILSCIITGIYLQPPGNFAFKELFVSHRCSHLPMLTLTKTSTFSESSILNNATPNANKIGTFQTQAERYQIFHEKEGTSCETHLEGVSSRTSLDFALEGQLANKPERLQHLRLRPLQLDGRMLRSPHSHPSPTHQNRVSLLYILLQPFSSFSFVFPSLLLYRPTTCTSLTNVAVGGLEDLAGAYNLIEATKWRSEGRFAVQRRRLRFRNSYTM